MKAEFLRQMASDPGRIAATFVELSAKRDPAA
jgi:hypothetical protein